MFFFQLHLLTKVQSVDIKQIKAKKHKLAELEKQLASHAMKFPILKADKKDDPDAKKTFETRTPFLFSPPYFSSNFLFTPFQSFKISILYIYFSM